MSWLIVGLGNPGPKYADNRHNIGFMVVDEFGRRIGETYRDKFKGQLATGRIGAEDVKLLKPMTYMNVSGTSVGAAGSFFKIPPTRTVVVHDELDLAFGLLRLKVGGGHAGHNGLRSIFQHYGKEFIRLRCGIGRPVHGDVANYVLSDFSADERISLDDVVQAAADAVEQVIKQGIKLAMNTVNQKSK